MKKMYLYISIANILSSFGVVMLHTNGIFWTFPSGRLWITSNLIETLFYWPVPIFFMITGITLINYQERYSTKKYFKKRFERTLFPFLFWNLIAIAKASASGHHLYSLKEILGGIFNSNFVSVYWFFIPLFAIYLSIPVISSIEKHKQIKVFKYCIFLAIVTVAILPLVFNLVNIQYNPDFVLYACSGYLMYPLIGYVIHHTEFNSKQRMIIYILAILGWFTQFYGTHVLSISAHHIVSTFKGYLNIPAILQATGVMILLKYIQWDKIIHSTAKKFILELQKLTFGIYLIHFFVISLLTKFFSINVASIWWRTIGAFVVFIVSGSICYIISKIPKVRKIIGLN